MSHELEHDSDPVTQQCADTTHKHWSHLRLTPPHQSTHHISRPHIHAPLVAPCRARQHAYPLAESGAWHVPHGATRGNPSQAIGSHRLTATHFHHTACDARSRLGRIPTTAQQLAHTHTLRSTRAPGHAPQKLKPTQRAASLWLTRSLAPPIGLSGSKDELLPKIAARLDAIAAADGSGERDEDTFAVDAAGHEIAVPGERRVDRVVRQL